MAGGLGARGEYRSAGLLVRQDPKCSTGLLVEVDGNPVFAAHTYTTSEYIPEEQKVIGDDYGNYELHSSGGFYFESAPKVAIDVYVPGPWEETLSRLAKESAEALKARETEARAAAEKKNVDDLRRRMGLQ